MQLDEVFDLYDRVGDAIYGGERISQTEHALQCALMAEQAGESDAVVTAALLHDFGHFLPPPRRTGDDLHHESGAAALTGLFAQEVTDIIRLHVAAKRYLCATDPFYWQTLSDVSQRSLEKQGGPFGQQDTAAFEKSPGAAAAIRVRRYDDMAKIVGAVTPSLAHYRDIAGKLTVY